ncbi:MAG: transglutaminase family protein [Thermomonas haemolytica]
MGNSVHRFWLVWLTGLLLAVAMPSASASDPLADIKAQFAVPDGQVNFADTKLAIDKAIDPSTDTAAIRSELDRWERAIRSNVPAGADSRQTLDALLKTLYEPGPWNEGNPFRYDLDDPLGKQPANKRLATYLATRKGNCVSMPILVAILGQRLGLTITLSTAPEHVMAMFADDAQQAWVYVEATGGGYKRDESYIRDTGISQTALDNEIYLRPLRPHEAVGVIASTLMEHYGRQQNGDALLAVADLALAANSKDTVAMIWKGNAYFLQLRDRYLRKYQKVAEIPADKVADFQRLDRENLAWFEKAKALGWTQKTPEQDAAYLQSIQSEKAKKGQ